jgi:putative oxidoreductase
MNAIVRRMPSVARVVLGLVFTILGANKFLHFLPQPPMSGPPADFFGALFATGYMLPLIATTEVVAGLLLLSGRFVPLALTLLAPVIVNILAFHLFLAPSGIAMPMVVLAAELYLAWSYREAFAPMLRARVAPGGAEATRPALRQAPASKAA